ncbi:MAG: hypothetical protein ACYS1A_10140 [Planctomycetota bacterium]|jgi:outer membrane lipoprotein-sorting protein
MNDSEKQFEDFVRDIRFDDSPNPDHRDELESRLLAEMTKKPSRQINTWRLIMKARIARLAAAAVIMILVMSGITFWPSGHPENGKWWLGSTAAWGQEIIEFLEDIEALVYREQFVHVSLYGSTHVSGQWNRNYEAINKSRKDTYFEPTDEDTYGDNSQASVLQKITWNVPDGEDLIRYDLSLEFQCYTINKNEGGAYERDPVERLRFYVNLLDKADRILDNKIFDGRECVGFEIDTSKYGNNPVGRIDRIWFDLETKLPVRIEKHGRPNRFGKTSTFIHDQFEYYTTVPAEIFEPQIPEDFINAHPDEIRAAREKGEKGDMVYVDVPIELRDEVIEALRNINVVGYRRYFESISDSNFTFNDGALTYSPRYGLEIVYLSRYDWRKDSYSGEKLQRTEWFAVNKDDWGKTSLDFNDENFVLWQTTVDFSNSSYKETKYGYQSHPDNPMDRIIFHAGIIDRADYMLNNTEIEGVECFGFEISAKKYGTNPETSKHRLWFDVETKLPVRMEFEWLEDDGPRTMVTDRFEWNPDLDEDFFTPHIPPDFTLKK